MTCSGAYTDDELRVLARGFADAAAHQHAAANELIAEQETAPGP